jgi:hypothetical protein
MRENIKLAWAEYLRHVADQISEGKLDLLKASFDRGIVHADSGGVMTDGREFLMLELYDPSFDRRAQ